MSDNPLSEVRAKLKETAGKSLDELVAAAEGSLAALWERDAKGELDPAHIPAIVEAFQQALKKVAPPPPKKVKLDVPVRKILSLAESSVRPALDVSMLLQGLVQIGDFTEQTDKAREAFRLFLDDWRRMVFESARIPSFAEFRRKAGGEERAIGPYRFSRSAAADVLEGLHRHRTDKFASVPDVSTLACSRCGGLKSRERLRCHKCRGLFCTRCFSPEKDVCLRDYAARYAGLDAAARKRVGQGAADLCRKYRLDAYVRTESFVKPLHEWDVDVVFQESAVPEGQETTAKGRFKLALRPREWAGTRRILFAALYRAWMRRATEPTPPPEDDPGAPPGPPLFEPASVADPLFQECFVDVCMGFAVEEAMA